MINNRKIFRYRENFYRSNWFGFLMYGWLLPVLLLTCKIENYDPECRGNHIKHHYGEYKKNI